MGRTRQENWQGMNWIRPAKRLALYVRDGLACCYCGEGIEHGATLTLDHLTPHSESGSNDATNLVTACKRCNSSRGARDWRDFAHAVAAYLNHGVGADAIINHIDTTTQRPFDLPGAKALIARRGGFSQALHGAE